MNKTVGFARYHQIALDIAQCIVNGKFLENQKLYGRSTLSSMYQVSPETIRKAVALLQDMDVLSVQPHSGIVINSATNARNFIERFSFIQSIGSLKSDLDQLLEEKEALDNRISKTLEEIVAYSHQLKNLSPYNPVEVKVPAGSHVADKTIAELRFWQNTGGTVVALRHGSEFIVAPGPYAILREGDSIVVVGNQGILQAVEAYVNRAD